MEPHSQNQRRPEKNASLRWPCERPCRSGNVYRPSCPGAARKETRHRENTGLGNGTRADAAQLRGHMLHWRLESLSDLRQGPEPCNHPST